METFKTIEGFEDYEVSNLGTVKSLKHGKEKILKPGHDACGYVHVRLYPDEPRYGFYKNGWVKPKLEKIHRLVALTFLPQPDNDTYQEVNHIDGDKKNNDVTNLEWISRKENVRHAWRTGLNEEGRELGGEKRRRPVMVTHKDGRVEYFASRNHCAQYYDASAGTISNKLRLGTFGRKGFKVESIDELPEGQSFTTSKELDEKVKQYRLNWRVYLNDYRERKNK